MPAALMVYITKYGLLAIFSIVFLQEIGVPNPIPTELIILFSGYLSSIGQLNFGDVFCASVAGDFIGTSVLYGLFYFFAPWILKHLPKKLPLEKIEQFKAKLAARAFGGVYIGRLMPYLRGYASVAAGLLKVPPKIFFPAVILSAVTWSGGYAIIGYLLGDRWTVLATKLGSVELILLLILILAFIFFILPRIIKRLESNHKSQP